MPRFECVRRHARLLFASLLFAAWLPSAHAGTGIYWSFVNHTAQDLRLRPDTNGEDVSCWDVSGIPWNAVAPAGLTSTYYVEVNCHDTELTVFVVGGPYDGERIGLWVDRRLPGRFRVTRNITSAEISTFTARKTISMGTSNSDMSTSLRLTGEGASDTVLAGTGFAARHSTPPPGSYRETCNADYDAEGWLHTDCQDASGAMVWDARLHYTGACAQGAQVANVDGYPVCDEHAAGVPAGSYLDTCRVVDFDSISGELRASCGGDQTARGVLRSLNVLYQCEAGSTVSNQGGNMVCDRPFTGPTGSYLSVCGDTSYDAGVLSASCRSFVPLGRLSLDYAARCAPWSTVRLDLTDNQLACDTPRKALPSSSARGRTGEVRP